MPLIKAFVAGGANTNFIGKKHPDFIWKRHQILEQRENQFLVNAFRTSWWQCWHGSKSRRCRQTFIGHWRTIYATRSYRCCWLEQLFAEKAYRLEEPVLVVDWLFSQLDAITQCWYSWLLDGVQTSVSSWWWFFLNKPDYARQVLMTLPFQLFSRKKLRHIKKVWCVSRISPELV